MSAEAGRKLDHMRSRSLAVGLSVFALIGVTACGSDGGTGASTVTTITELSSPVYATAAPVPTTTTVVGVPTDPAAPGGVAGEQLYTVVGGDYLFGIAKKFCLDAATIAAYNVWPDGTNHPLYAGSEVKIPGGACAPGATPTTVAGSPGATTAPPAATTPATATTSAETTTTVDAAAGATYTVVNGDYLAGIATKNGTTVDAIVAANGWSDGANHPIFPGDKIKLPAKTG